MSTRYFNMFHRKRIAVFLLLSLGCLAWNSARLENAVPQSDRVDSHQALQPVRTGFLSGISLGFWPAAYGSDLIGLPDGSLQGISRDAYSYIVRHNLFIVKVWQWLSFFTYAPGALYLFAASRRHNG